MTCRPQRAWIRWQDRIKTTASAIVSFLLKWDLSIVQSHIPILFKSAQVKCVFLQKLWQPSFEMVWSQSGHWWYRWLVEKWRQGSTEEDWPGQISQMERDVISKTEIILPFFKWKQSLFNQLNQHQAPSTYNVYCKLLSAKKKMPSNLLLSADSLICDRSVVCTRICKFATNFVKNIVL